MPPSSLPSPSSFSPLSSDPENPPSPPPREHFPTTLPPRPGKSTSYLRTLLRKQKTRITLVVLFFLILLGGVIGAALFLTKVLRRGETALADTTTSTAQTINTMAPTVTPAVSPSVAPTPTKILVTQTTLVTMVSTATGMVSVPWAFLPLPSVATKTVVKGPECTGAMGNAAVCAGDFPLGDLVKPGKDGKGDEEGK